MLQGQCLKVFDAVLGQLIVVMPMHTKRCQASMCRMTGLRAGLPTAQRTHQLFHMDIMQLFHRWYHRLRGKLA